jgi:hypothetical protein
MLIKRYITKEDFLKLKPWDGVGSNIGGEYCASLNNKECSSVEQLKKVDIGDKVFFLVITRKMDSISPEINSTLVSAELIKEYPKYPGFDEWIEKHCNPITSDKNFCVEKKD